MASQFLTQLPRQVTWSHLSLLCSTHLLPPSFPTRLCEIRRSFLPRAQIWPLVFVSQSTWMSLPRISPGAHQTRPRLSATVKAPAVLLLLTSQHQHSAHADHPPSMAQLLFTRRFCLSSLQGHSNSQALGLQRKKGIAIALSPRQHRL